MICPCGGATIVKDGRYIPEGYWRRRKCSACGTESTTLEQVCETVKGNRVSQPRVIPPRSPKVIRPKRPREKTTPKEKKPAPVKHVPRETAQSRMEDMRMEREYG